MKDNIENEKLLDAVAARDVNAVQGYLERGADPNYTIKIEMEGTDDAHQPTMPLKMVMFCMSDCNLEDSHLEQLADIARLLLQYGADPAPAMYIAESRYGKYDPTVAGDDPFWNVYRIVANAFHQSK